ncbi:TPA: type II toxin-antitoxin system RelE/ParE family toxin [Citrobacter farmeri]|uniref:type II toxin-antitoxin system RelE/ParE family toxin n=1 Tax=Citrobacter farmeri TaxID=67824 RepID=UPI000F660CA2|nr:type II toxin-antitoxin system RelE/ParE family toxin [Citrobacter farmeri]RSB16797.1 type II toxin-antitoxin system RelE/ParE family toxin [Citrobacter farmeri]HEM6743335.1 type II toxin-antitoxin system RelE/ParE family toxin [Citrobacter farmeri]HEM8561920.1 type II toxin-antitoxin system RelE/ParE family toxin [Citrobacter farmeri]
MEHKITFEYTLTVRHCINDIVLHLRRAEIEPRPVVADILTQFEKVVGQFPAGSQICHELLKIGCAKYREFNHVAGYRVLYSIDGMHVTAHAILARRQDVQQLLFKRLIMV